MHEDGLARFATELYAKPGKPENPNHRQYAHLTNYAINKDSQTFKISESDIAAGKSSKRTLKTVYDTLEKHGINIHFLKLKIVDIILKTLISI